MRSVNRDAAHLAPHRHTMIPGLGYLDIGELPKPRLAARGTCLPPTGALDGSSFKLKSPHGAVVEMTWRKVLWWSPKPTLSNRLAWTPSHLAQAGWSVIK